MMNKEENWWQGRVFSVRVERYNGHEYFLVGIHACPSYLQNSVLTR